MRRRHRRALRGLMGTEDLVQAGAVCRDGGGRVMLITSRDTGRWVIPKGWPMRKKTLAQTALQESWEEAGVEGSVSETPSGEVLSLKCFGPGLWAPVRMLVYSVLVESVADAYPEAEQRQRLWTTPSQAAEMVREPDLSRILWGLTPDPRPCPCTERTCRSR